MSQSRQRRDSLMWILFVAAINLGATGCGLLSFDIDVPIEEQRVTGNPVGGALGGFTDSNIPININLEAETSARDTGPVQEVFLSSLSFSITSTGQSGAGDVDTFDFINNVEVYVSSSRSGSTLARVLVGSLSAIPAGATRIDLVPTEANIKAHIEEGAAIESTASGTIPPDDVTFDGSLTMTFEVL